MAKIVFIPFSDAEGNTVEQAKIQQWIDTRGGYSFACYSGSALPAIKGAGLFDEIYILAHGSAGASSVSGDAGHSLTYQALADRLIASGLSPRYAGCVKVYACRSGERDGGESSFARRFAKYLIKEKKRYLCSVYGYAGNLTSHSLTEEEARGSGDTKKHHKWSRMPDHSGDQRVTASSRRKRFYGLV